MNLTIPCAVSLAETVAAAALKYSGVDVAIFPTFVSLLPVAERIRGSQVALGAQDVFWKESGAFTGEISAAMLSDVGCRYCIVGHSERRGRFGVSDDTPAGFFSDTNATVQRKISALVYTGIIPILCVGETADERSNGLANEVIETQLAECLEGVEAPEMVIAYEPVWAIGTGQVCDPAEAESQCRLIREIAQHDNLRVVYGGSVNAQNAASLFSMPSIDGALVGGASLKADDFARIIGTG